MLFNGLKNYFHSKKSKSDKESSKTDEPDFDPNPMLQANDITTEKLIGKGHYSYVYSGYFHKQIPAAIKIIRRGDDKSEENELEILNKLKGKKHIVQLYDGFIQNDHAIFVFEKIESISQNEILSATFSIDQFKFYLKCVLEALKEAHRVNIIHRDLRFQNILISLNFENVTVIDWGCGTKINNLMRSSVGARTTRSPEMLMGYTNYGTKGDIWSIGVLILYILSNGNIPWNDESAKKSFVKMSTFFGAKNLLDLEKTLHIHFQVKKLRKLEKEEILPLKSVFAEKYKNFDDKDLLDIINKCFTLDYRLRPSASDLLDHNFFKSLA